MQLVTSGYSKIFLLTDSNVAEQCLDILLPIFEKPSEIEILEIEPGEQSKAPEIALQIIEQLLESEVDRKALLINFGGGVVSDLGGFIASIYKRGISFVNIPTSLMGMCDASIGGKTGIDFLHYKNVIGSFAQPKAVIVYPPFISSLPKEELLSGYAEMVKHAIIADSRLFEALETIEPTDADHVSLFIERSAQIKQEIVEKDYLEKGLRKILNFGHTIGHAVESYFLENETPISHGHAVALGMRVEAYVAYLKGHLPIDQLMRIRQLIQLPFPLPRKIYWEDLVKYLIQDKKNNGKQILIAIPASLGTCAWDIAVTEEDLRSAWEEELSV